MTDQPIKTVINWSKKPKPWCDIGPAFKREVEAICRGHVDHWPPPFRAPDSGSRKALHPRPKT